MHLLSPNLKTNSAPTSLDDHTTSFLKQMAAQSLDDWCLAKGIVFQCTLHNHADENDNYVSFLFHQQGMTVGFIDLVAFRLPKDSRFAPVVTQFVAGNTALVDVMLQMQRNFKLAGLPANGLRLRVPLGELSPRDMHTELSKAERRLRSNKTAMLRIFLSRNTPCGTIKKPRNFDAFMYRQTGKASAYLVYEGGQPHYLALEAKERRGSGNYTYHRYESKDLLNCIEDTSILPAQMLTATKIDAEFLAAARKVFQAEQKIKAETPLFDMYDLSTMEI